MSHGTERPCTGCDCSWSGYTNHDQLADWFRIDSPERTDELFVEAVSYVDCDHDGQVPFFEWPEFVAEHNWPEPKRTRTVAIAMRDIVEAMLRAPERSPQPPVSSLVDRLDDLEARVMGMAHEVRTRRLVVVDDHGRERVVGECTPGSEDMATLRVQDPTGERFISLDSLGSTHRQHDVQLYVGLDGNGAFELSAGNDPAVDDSDATAAAESRLVAWWAGNALEAPRPLARWSWELS